MRILLDTHAFLWFFTNDPKLSLPALSQIADRANEVLISPASYREVAIKVSLGKYPLSVSFEQFWTAGIIENDFRILPVTVAHASTLLSLPMHHKDPFDRMIISQEITEQIPVVSADSAYGLCDLERIW